MDTTEFKARCTRFGRDVLAPEVDRCDRENRFAETVHAEAFRQGLVNRSLPEHLGGQGRPYVELVEEGEILAAICAPIAFSLGFNHGSLVPLLQGGSPEQQERLVATLLKEGGQASLCLTEPDSSGSNLLEIQTTAQRTDSGWILEGEKCMVGNGTHASLFLVLAQARDGERSLGPTFFAVPQGDGVQVGENPDKLGFRALPTPPITLEVEVPDENRVGSVGAGIDLLLPSLDIMRVGGGAVILGLVQGALNVALPWIQERELHGGRLFELSHVQMQLGAIFARLEAARTVLHDAARRLDAGQPFSRQATIAKLLSSKLAEDATHAVVQLMGWRGIRGDYPIQKRFRDARQTTIYEGSTEVLERRMFRELLAAGGGEDT
jgi:alkylation response protein AidB-like acyl-CoA dehydrogenase